MSEPITASTVTLSSQPDPAAARRHTAAATLWRAFSVLLVAAGVTGLAVVALNDTAWLRAVLAILGIGGLAFAVPAWEQGTAHADEAKYWRGERS